MKGKFADKFCLKINWKTTYPVRELLVRQEKRKEQKEGVQHEMWQQAMRIHLLADQEAIRKDRKSTVERYKEFKGSLCYLHSFKEVIELQADQLTYLASTS